MILFWEQKDMLHDVLLMLKKIDAAVESQSKIITPGNGSSCHRGWIDVPCFKNTITQSFRNGQGKGQGTAWCVPLDTGAWATTLAWQVRKENVEKIRKSNFHFTPFTISFPLTPALSLLLLFTWNWSCIFLFSVIENLERGCFVTSDFYKWRKHPMKLRFRVTCSLAGCHYRCFL